REPHRAHRRVTTSFDTTGYIVLRSAFDAESLAAELDRALNEGVTKRGAQVGDAGIAFRYVPMMCERTPVGLALIDTLAGAVSQFVGRAVLPGRAKATEYTGDSALHADSDRDIVSIGCLAYLEPLDGPSGALQVIPRSGDAPVVLPTMPGDVIVFDER